MTAAVQRLGLMRGEWTKLGAFVRRDSATIRRLLAPDVMVWPPSPDTARRGSAAIGYLQGLALSSRVNRSDLRPGNVTLDGRRGRVDPHERTHQGQRKVRPSLEGDRRPLAGELLPVGPLPVSPGWLTRIETVGTTLVVLMVGAMMIWNEAVERERRLAFTLGSAVLVYVTILVIAARRSAPGSIPWWPFAAAGVLTGGVAELPCRTLNASRRADRIVRMPSQTR